MATPSAVRIFKRPLVMRERIQFTWDAPVQSLAGPVLNYELSDGFFTFNLSPSTRTYLVSNLNEGQAYTFSIRALNAAGWGAVATWPSVITGIRPGNVSDLSGNISGTTNADIYWSLATNDGNSQIKRQVLYAYAYDLSGNRSEGDDIKKSYYSDTTSAFVSNFTVDRNYHIHVKAVNDVGYSYNREEGPYIQLSFLLGQTITGFLNPLGNNDSEVTGMGTIPFPSLVNGSGITYFGGATQYLLYYDGTNMFVKYVDGNYNYFTLSLVGSDWIVTDDIYNRPDVIGYVGFSTV
jgi:hypothetical protein